MVVDVPESGDSTDDSITTSRAPTTTVLQGPSASHWTRALREPPVRDLSMGARSTELPGELGFGSRE
jgi:hypothetical protein